MIETYQNQLGSLNYPTGSSSEIKREYRNRSLGNVLRMFHCAPTVMKTVLDAAHTEQEWLVKLTAGMPGGIGNTGHECGGVTSPLMLLGLRYGLGNADRGLPLIFYKGTYLCDRFSSCNQTMQCKEIQGDARVPVRCVNVIRHSPEILAEAIARDCKNAIPEATREAHCRLYSHLLEKCFHCSQAVFQNLQDTVPVSQDVFFAASAFIGGTLFQGRTCSAFTSGVMAIGLMTGEIENSFPRVVRMIAIMALGGNAFGDDLNKFHKSMNTGYRLSKWFKKEFGSTQCREITGCDFSKLDGVNRYIENDGVTRCRAITAQVAKKVGDVLST
jgi:C_GCAxxG_C_C family probable redox protein